MATFTYNLNIPEANNNPSEDQPDMQENTNSIDSLINVDHFSFGESNHDGEHRQVTMPLRGGGSGSIPPGRIADEGTLYTKTANAETQLFYTPDASGNQYQLSRTNTAGIASFGAYAAYGVAPVGTVIVGGWTFLPGGLLMQYGTVTGSGGASTLPSTAIIPFPISFTTSSINVQLEIRRNDPANAGTSVSRSAPPTTTGFTYFTSATSGDALYWVAIGI